MHACIDISIHKRLFKTPENNPVCQKLSNGETNHSVAEWE